MPRKNDYCDIFIYLIFTVDKENFCICIHYINKAIK